MTETRQEKTIEAIRDWSRWLIGINFGAAVGCAVVLQTSNFRGTVTPFLIVAIVFFASSVFCCILLGRGLARVVEMLPLNDEAGIAISVFDHKVIQTLTVGALASLQFGLLATGVIFFIVWVIVKSVNAA